MTGFLWATLGVLGGLAMTAIGDMVSEEVRDRLDHVPQAILRLAARQLDSHQRITIYEDVWLPDLAYFLKGDEARPVTRLVQGTRFAFGILIAASRMTRKPWQRKHSIDIRIHADFVRISGYPGREWAHEAFTGVLNEMVELREKDLANARGILARRRAIAGLHRACQRRDQIVRAMQEYANNWPRSRPECNCLDDLTDRC